MRSSEKNTRRKSRINKDVLQLYRHEMQGPGDGVLEIISRLQKSDDTSTWYGTEILYTVPVKRRREPGANNNTNNAQSPASSPTRMKRQSVYESSSPRRQSVYESASPRPGSVISDRYLIVVKKASEAASSSGSGSGSGSSVPSTSSSLAPSQFHYLIVIKKGGNVVVKQKVELASIRSMDYGSDETQLLLQLASAEQTVFFLDSTGRDETVWVIMQLVGTLNGR
jgi:hypothetical protein